MSGNIVVIVQDDNSTTVVQQEQDTIAAATSLYNPLTVPSLSTIGDVDTSILNNGSVLVYKTNTNKWTSTTTLDLQNMEGGEF